jgi:hypothetical protein
MSCHVLSVHNASDVNDIVFDSRLAGERVQERPAEASVSSPSCANTPMTNEKQLNASDTESGDEAPTIHLHLDEMDVARMSAGG